jgi:hypothetical protein
MIALVAISVGLGGIGLGIEPGTGFWWSLRPVWLVCLVCVLVPFLLVFMRFENASRAKGAALPGPAQALVGALATCAGLVMMALDGIGSDGTLGVNVAALGLVVAGVAIATLGRKTA